MRLILLRNSVRQSDAGESGRQRTVYNPAGSQISADIPAGWLGNAGEVVRDCVASANLSRSVWIVKLASTGHVLEGGLQLNLQVRRVEALARNCRNDRSGVAWRAPIHDSEARSRRRLQRNFQVVAGVMDDGDHKSRVRLPVDVADRRTTDFGQGVGKSRDRICKSRGYQGLADNRACQHGKSQVVSAVPMGWISARGDSGCRIPR